MGYLETRGKWQHLIEGEALPAQVAADLAGEVGVLAADELQLWGRHHDAKGVGTECRRGS